MFYRAEITNTSSATIEIKEYKMLEIDLNEAKKGYEIEFRCGGKATILTIEKHHKCITISFGDNGNYQDIQYWQEGEFYFRGDTKTGEHPFDIVKITPAPFDWSTVRAGMCFLYDGCEVYFCFGVNGSMHFSLDKYACPQELSYKLDELERSPERDIAIDFIKLNE